MLHGSNWGGVSVTLARLVLGKALSIGDNLHLNDYKDLFMKSSGR